MMRAGFNVTSVNCKWYFGHDVQVVTFYLHPSTSWCVAVYPADSTRASATDSSSNHHIHLYADSTNSLYQALERAQWQMEERIGKLFRMPEGETLPILENYTTTCHCQHPSDLPRNSIAEHQKKVEELETRLQVVEHTLLLVDEDRLGSPSGSSAQACSIQEIGSTLQKIESKLEAIELQMQHRAAETATPAALPAGPMIDEVTDISDAPICAELVTPTPVAVATGRSIAPSAGQDGPVELSRDFIREEINRALAEALIELGGVFSGRCGSNGV